jgi:hypothetical protein
MRSDRGRHLETQRHFDSISYHDLAGEEKSDVSTMMPHPPKIRR